MIHTLKELKKEYPDLITTSGNNYYIDGLGWFKQRKTAFGVETYTKDYNDEWIRTDFNDLAGWLKRMYR